MAGWDKSAPADSGSGITTENAKTRVNWDEIEDHLGVDHYTLAQPRHANYGEHKQVTLLELAADPNGGAQVANTGFFYTKNWSDADSNDHTEGYFMDAEATPNIVQLTKRGQPFGAPAAWCVFNNAGGNVSSFNATPSGSGGTYTITFDNSMESSNYLVVASTTGSAVDATGAYVCSYAIVDEDSCIIYTYKLKLSDNTMSLAAALGNTSVAFYDL